MSKAVLSVAAIFLCTLAGIGPALASHCVVPDNGTGTADFPPNCLSGYRNTAPYLIVNGLPAGDTIEGNGPIYSIVTFSNVPGGGLGGNTQGWNGYLTLNLSGTGSLAGFSRAVDIPIQGQTDTAPTVPGDPNQPFVTDLVQLQGQLPPGDPDFDLLRITAGASFGMPSPGHTTLIHVGSGQWAVDSFFDITYRIDFVGAPAGALSGMSGSTTGTVHVVIPIQEIFPGEDHWTTIDETLIDFNLDVPPIPAGFFYPGSAPFSGVVSMVGVPRLPELSNADTVVSRFVPLDLPSIGSAATTPLGVVYLGLHSTNPIDVGGVFFDVDMQLDPLGSHTGTMDVVRQRRDGGTFNSSITVQPIFEFAPVSGGPSLPYSGLPPITFSTGCPHSWSERAPAFAAPGTGPEFFPGPEPEIDISRFATSRHTIVPATASQPFSACNMPDNGGGTAVFPPACPSGYGTDPSTPGFNIINGLPPGSTLEGSGSLVNLMISGIFPGGGLGGEVEQFSGDLGLRLIGTGAYTGYFRTFVIPHVLESHTAPRFAYFPVQDFATDMARMQGQLAIGDPDFDLLRITAGTAFAMPSPGQSRYAMRPDGSWAVDSFFDITYRIDFVGHAPGPFGGMSGSTTGVTRIRSSSISWHPLGECLVPDAGGTADMPAVCGSGYWAKPDTIVIQTGLPPASTLTITPELVGLSLSSVTPGGVLFGDITQFDGRFRMNMFGTGGVGGFFRRIDVPVTGENHNGPKSPGLMTQEFPMELVSLQGQIIGDPDFDLLRISAGSGFGLPSPGRTFIQQNPGPINRWATDTYFDITYRIDYIGAVGGPLSGMSGSEIGRVRLQAGPQAITAGDDPWLTLPQTELCFGCGVVPPIPAGFFYPGSAPFVGIVPLTGAPLDPLQSDADTVMQRMTDVHLPRIGSRETIPIELVQLSLVSTTPITPDGINFFDVEVTMAPGTTSPGSMSFVRGTTDGGGFLTNFVPTMAVSVRPVGFPGPIAPPMPNIPLPDLFGVCPAAWQQPSAGGLPLWLTPAVANPDFWWETPYQQQSSAAFAPHGAVQATRASGACCTPAGTCEVRTGRDCILTGGLPQGAGTLCLGDSNGDLIDDKCQAAFPLEVSPQGAPVPFKAEIVAGGQLRLSWQTTPGAATYELFFANSADLRIFGGFNMTTALPMGCGLPGISIIMPMPPGDISISVAADNAAGTGPIGYASSGIQRTAVPCP